MVGHGETDDRAADGDKEAEDLDEDHCEERTGIHLLGHTIQLMGLAGGTTSQARPDTLGGPWSRRGALPPPGAS